MLRAELAAGTELGKEVDRLTSVGQFAPDSVVNGIVQNWLSTHDGNFVFDGYPRTLSQGETLEQFLADRDNPVQVAFFLNVNMETIRERIVNRVSCADCRGTFSKALHLTSEKDGCPECEGQLVRRKDDTLEALEQRMVEYREKTEPLISFYQTRGVLEELSASASPEDVFREIARVLEAA